VLYLKNDSSTIYKGNTINIIMNLGGGGEIRKRESRLF
jgi:hypothetical protein